MNINQLRLKNKKKYLIVNSDKFKTENDFLDAIAQKLNEGIDIIELRETNTNPYKIISIGKKIRELCSIYNTIFIVNDRIDIAQIINADGIFLNKFSIDIVSARNLTNKETIIGRIVSNESEIEEAKKEGADYLIYEKELKTQTKIPYFIFSECQNL